jgi:UDP-N-acetylmuramate: L-alanyl-gamma-D-glutamyl-meso-diaminopimelate ligase
MGALALLFRQDGHDVTGSDVAFDPPIGPSLRDAGVQCMQGYEVAHVAPRPDLAPDLVIVGNAIRRDNPEAVYVREQGLAASSMSAALRAHFLEGRRPLVVTGTHGKTTTSAMCAWLLHRAELEPGWFIGGLPKDLPGGAAIGSRTRRLVAAGKPSPFVVEGDEYDAVYWDKKPKFLDYVPVGQEDVVILTSIEHDHIDIYASRDAYEAEFAKLVARIPSRGRLICDARDPVVRGLVEKHASCTVSWYALDGDDTGAITPTWLGAVAGEASPNSSTAERGSAFDLFVGGMSCGRFALQVPGRHNVRNAIAALCACAEGFAVPLERARPALAAFQGVRRRQDLLGTPRGVFVYDDFAHHPTAVRETLRALKARHGQGRLFAIFEPRSATACRNLHQEEYSHAFDDADRAIFAPLGRSNVPEAERLDLTRLVAAMNGRASALSHADIVATIASEARSGDVVAILSNGAFAGMHDKLLAALAKEAP